MRKLISDFPRVSEIAEAIHIDFAESEPDSYALSSTGDELVAEDILGNQKRKHTFIFYSVWQSQSDYDRLSNSGVLLGLHQWLEMRGRGIEVTSTIDGVQYGGEITKLTCSNGMLFAIPPELSGGVQYQIQITAEYKIYTGE